MDLSENAIDTDANCSVRDSLNASDCCLAKIFIYLDVSTLMNLAEMSDCQPPSMIDTVKKNTISF